MKRVEDIRHAHRAFHTMDRLTAKMGNGNVVTRRRRMPRQFKFIKLEWNRCGNGLTLEVAIQ